MKHNLLKVDGGDVYRQHQPEIGTFSLQTLRPQQDSTLLHSWFLRDYARFWNMGHYSREGVAEFYEKLQASGHAAAYMGYFDDRPAFIMESYDPRHDQVGKHYVVNDGDWGMHFLVAPPERVIAGFTLAIIRTILSFHFSHPAIKRLVVEPDVRNDKVHELNRKVGFVYSGNIQLEEKMAALAFVTRDQFNKTMSEKENA